MPIQVSLALYNYLITLFDDHIVIFCLTNKIVFVCIFGRFYTYQKYGHLGKGVRMEVAPCVLKKLGIYIQRKMKTVMLDLGQHDSCFHLSHLTQRIILTAMEITVIITLVIVYPGSLRLDKELILLLFLLLVPFPCSLLTASNVFIIPLIAFPCPCRAC